MTAILVLVLRFALAIALYAFLGWILFTFWQELKQQGQILSAQKKPGIQIHARLENGKEIHHQFLQTEVTIGRDPNCDFPVIDEAISAHHARISYHHTQWWLEDLSSTNGTYIGNSQVTVPTVLITSDQFKCGNTLFNVRVEVVVE
ncbi:MAG TPA: FHA domain-containing protein [Anaerolineales bacterium]|jgi:pSer/pThr/pTyr-binding forkhead associated (FHA) protein|nr:FHA domain-containing protein [Anaerolineales bacterium]